jgi:cell division protein FtsX
VTRAWLLRRLVGDLRRHAGVWLALGAAFAAVGVCAAGTRLATVAPNAAAAALHEAPAQLVAYLDDQISPEKLTELVGVLSRLPEVQAVRVVSAGEGLQRLRAELGARAAVLEGVGPDLLFPSLEIAARPAAASALAFRLRRLGGIADVDLVPAPPAAARPAALGLASAPARVALGVASFTALLALAGALALLRARFRGELAVLLTFGATRGSSARPAVTLGAMAGALGAALGVLGARLASSAWLGAALPPREWAIGVAALVLLALGAAVASVRAPEAARAG